MATLHVCLMMRLTGTETYIRALWSQLQCNSKFTESISVYSLYKVIIFVYALCTNNVAHFVMY